MRISRMGVYGLCLAAGVALGACTLGLGFFQEDFAHLTNLRYAESWTVRLATYMVPGGFWFNADTLFVRFFRPVTVLLLYLDMRVFGSHSWLYHAHSVAWFCVWIASALQLLRTTLPFPAWRCAALFIALSAIPVVSTAVISTRYALINAAIGALAIACHVVWRERGRRMLAPLACLLYACALLSAEIALTTLGFVVAYEAVRALRGDRPAGAAARSFVFGVSGVVFVTVAYLAFYVGTGHGGGGSDIYIVPFEEPVRFLAAVPGRLLLAFGTLFTGVSIEPIISDETISQEGLAWLLRGLYAAGALFFVLVGWGWYRVRHELNTRERQALAWLLLGTLLSSAAITPNLPMARMLLLPACGVVGALAILCVRLLQQGRHEGGGRWNAAWLAVILLVFVVLQPVMWVGQVWLLNRNFSEQRAIALEADLDEASGHRALYLICSDQPLTALSIPVIRRWNGLPAPYEFDVLSLMRVPHLLTREDDHTLVLEPESGTFFDGFLMRVFWSRNFPFQPGDRRNGRGFEVEVLAASEGRPTRIRARFAEPLGAERHLLATMFGGELRELALPPVGVQVRLAATD